MKMDLDFKILHNIYNGLHKRASEKKLKMLLIGLS
jgi:hypothetical protein